MCGIIGSYRIGIERLSYANKLQRHRGPDDSGIFFDHKIRVGLAHTRLSIIDLSKLGHQPMISDDSQVVLVFNGEIYNYKTLRRELEEKGFYFKSQTDTEVILKLYLAEGENMLSKLNGIFAISIWNKRKKEFFIARDGLGVKPLYYTFSNDQFAFASEIKTLLYLIPEAKKLDHLAISRYLTFLFCPGNETPLKSIKKLLPGEAMLVRSGKIERKWNWYKLPYFIGLPENLNRLNSINGTKIHLKKAVERQMVSDVPIGAFLSGGLDSSAIVALAREIDPKIQCFTIKSEGNSEEGIVDDLPFAKKVATHLKVPLETVSIDSKKIANDIEKMVPMLDEPLADPASFNVYYISKVARENGIKVLLSGTGGDDLFTGYRRHYAIQLGKYWKWLPKSIKIRLELGSSKLDSRKPFQRRIAKFFDGASLDDNAHLANYFCWSRKGVLKSLFTDEFLNSIDLDKRFEPMTNFLKPLSNQVSDINKMLTLEQRFFLADHNLNYIDKMSMANGVEVRVPFLDLDLVNLSAQIPTKYKQKGSNSKWVLKKSMESYLPKEIIYRTKSGFGAPLRIWIKKDLKNLFGDFLSNESLNRRGFFSPQAVQKLIIDNGNGKIDAGYTLFSLLVFEIWCRSFLDIKF